MSLLEISLTANKDLADSISDSLSELGALSVSYLGADENDILEPGPNEAPLWDTVKITALFQSDTQAKHISKCIHDLYGDITTSHQFLEDKDWQNEWQKYVKPMQFGDFWICPSKEELEKLGKGMIIPPGLAFGTGSHPTTALCLAWLQKAKLEGKTLLDFGCGSGILALAALSLGAKTVLALDHEPQALFSTKDNAALNNISLERIPTYLSPKALPQGETYDGIIANILLEPLVELAPLFARLLKTGSDIILSGVLIKQLDTLQDAYSKDFEWIGTEQKEQWALLHLRRI